MNVTPGVADYMMDCPGLSRTGGLTPETSCRWLFNRACVDQASGGKVYSGAWAYPESCGCCGRCLSAGPWLLAPTWARYGLGE